MCQTDGGQVLSKSYQDDNMLVGEHLFQSNQKLQLIVVTTRRQKVLKCRHEVLEVLIPGHFSTKL